MKKHLIALLAFAVLTFGMAGCDSGPIIVDSWWYMYNFDPALSTTGASGLRGYNVQLDDPDGLDDIVLVTVTDPDGKTWTLHDPAFGVDYMYGIYDTISYTAYSSTALHSAALGTYEIYVEDASGQFSTGTYEVTAPGGVAATGCVATEDDGGASGCAYTMIPRAIPDPTTPTVRVDANTITVHFTTPADSRIYNTRLYVYDSLNSNLGGSGLLLGNSALNGNGVLNTDGTANTVTLTSALLGLVDLNSVVKVKISLTDGQIYTDPNTYEYRSATNYIAVP